MSNPRHRPAKSNPSAKLRDAKLRLPADQKARDIKGREYWLHPTKGWRSQGKRK